MTRVTDPILYLRQEHEHGLAALDRLESGLRALGREEAALETIRAAVRFVDFEIRHHNEREEKTLFPKLREHIPPGGPLEVMEAEHRELWEHLDRLQGALREAGGSLDPGGETAMEIRRWGSAVVSVLRGHIEKENMILFRMADQLLTPEEKSAIAEEMERLIEAEETSGGESA